jgi:dienelactone hydrolase
MTYPKKVFLLILVSTIYLAGLSLAHFYNTNFGDITVTKVVIPDQPKIICLYYQPKEASTQNQLPAVVLTHGISSSKQMMSSIALELAKNGFVTLTTDLIGHGDSGGIFGGFANETVDKTLGMYSALQYLVTQPYVNSSQIGLVGHSLGAGAVRATAATFNNTKATVFIGGGIGENIKEPEYGTLNSTFPKNLLIIIGEHDTLFNIKETKRELIPIFGSPSEIMPNKIYGNFSEETARNLVIPKATHLLELIDQTTVSEIVNWMKTSLRQEKISEEPSLTYLNREIGISISLAAFTSLIFPFSSIIIDHFPSLKKGNTAPKGNLKDWQVFIIWGTLGLLLFLPAFFIGSMIPFPPLIFGNSFSWWLFTTAIVGLLIAQIVLPKHMAIKVNLKCTLTQSFNKTNIIIATAIFLLLYSIVGISEIIFLTDLRIIIIPLFKSLATSKRILAFFTFLPFYLTYFFVEGLYLHKLRTPSTKSNQIKDLIKAITIRTAPYLALVALHYLPMFLFNIRIFPSFLGFIMEFILGIIPLFLISIIYSWWFYKKTKNLTMGTVINTLLFAWVSAAIFPISI